MAQGTVRWFNPESGYGFIIDDESGQDLFVRYSDIEGTGFRTLQEDQRVDYFVMEGPKGAHASRVRPI
ncbi:MAG: cold-shock protein [Corynebacterium glucuronolyticum]|nr:cold-shock protein [Corynebacterium glucuronolyticum]MDD7587667.1 cold-shock protein [Mycobacteriaceae bacterium]MDY5833913.1 cold-shock protein [Corynebacterium glucuronolyticum]